MMKFYIHGNCQSTVYKRMLGELGLPARSREVHTIDIETDIENYISDIMDADIIISQFVSDNYREEPRLSLKWIRENKRKNTYLITILPIYLLMYHPGLGYIKDARSYGMPYHDYNLVELYMSGRTASDTAEIISDIDFLPVAFLKGELSRTLSESFAREKQFQPDVLTTAMIEQAMRSQVLMHTFNHPARPLFVMLLEHILDTAGLDNVLPAEGMDYLSRPALWPHSSVLNFLGLGKETSDFGVRTPTEQVTWPCYIERLFAFYDEQYGRDTLAKAIKATPTAHDYIARFRSATG